VIIIKYVYIINTNMLTSIIYFLPHYVEFPSFLARPSFITIVIKKGIRDGLLYSLRCRLSVGLLKFVATTYELKARKF
jgi:hypothetical protein